MADQCPSPVKGVAQKNKFQASIRMHIPMFITTSQMIIIKWWPEISAAKRSRSLYRQIKQTPLPWCKTIHLANLWSEKPNKNIFGAPIQRLGHLSQVDHITSQSSNQRYGWDGTALLPKYLWAKFTNLKSDLHSMIDLRKLLTKGLCQTALINITLCLLFRVYRARASPARILSIKVVLCPMIDHRMSSAHLHIWHQMGSEAKLIPRQAI